MSLFRSDDPSGQDKIEIPLSLFATTKDNTPLTIDGVIYNGVETWPRFVAMQQLFSQTEYDQKADAPLFVPTMYHPARRNKEFATTSGMLVIDADHGLHYEAARERLIETGIEALLHTSGSNTQDDRFRIIIPLASPVGIEDQRLAVRAFCRYLYPNELQHPDIGKMNAVSMFYVAGRYARVFNKQTEQYESVVNRFDHLSGGVLSATDWIEACPDPEPRYAERFTPREDRGRCYATVGAALAESCERSEAAEPSVTHVLSAARSENRTLRRDAKWNIEDCGPVRAYAALPPGEHHAGLFRMVYGIACAAYNAGYDLSASELADFAWEVHAPSRHRHPRSCYQRWQVDNMATDAVRSAPDAVPDPFFKRAYAPLRPMAGVMSMAAMVKDLMDNPPPEWEEARKRKEMVEDFYSKFRNRRLK